MKIFLLLMLKLGGIMRFAYLLIFLLTFSDRAKGLL